MFDKSKGARPLYIQLEDLLMKDLKDGKYKPGDIIPTDLDYQNKYNLSRITVRQGINQLVLNGYLKRIKGKGTIVLPPIIKEPLVRIKSFTKELLDNGVIPSTKYAKILITKSFGEISQNLYQIDGDETYKLTRICCANGIPIVIFETYLKKQINMSLDNNTYYGSLYNYLKEEKNIEVTRVAQRISASVADSKISQLLNIKVGDPILILKRQSFDSENNIIEYTICNYVAERYEYSIEIKNGS